MADNVQRFGEWYKARKIFNNLSGKFTKAYQRALMKVGLHMRKKIRQGIRAGAPGGQKFQALSQFTIERKGSSKPLIDNADLIQSITIKVVDTDAVFVGLNRNARGKDGQDLVNIGAIHEGVDPNTGEVREHGAVIPVTAKMRGWFWHNFNVHLTNKAIIIPKRPFLRPTLEAEADEVIKIFHKELSKVFEGKR